MTVPVLTFFNNKGGIGKTSLVYHLSWMLADLGHRTLVADLDPQANLTASFLDEETLEALWDDSDSPATIHQCVQPLTQVGDLEEPILQAVSDGLSLLPGDLALSSFEDHLSSEWPNCLGSLDLFRPFRVTTAFWQVLQLGAEQCDAEIVLVDVGPSLGAINRAALIATDFIVVPLAADLHSRQGLRNLGPTLRRWRTDWATRHEHWQDPEFPLPPGRMMPVGYVIQQHGVRLSRPVRAHDRWTSQMPGEYSRSILDEASVSAPEDVRDDDNCIATVKRYRSLIPLSQEARKPVFELAPADGALGAHAVAAQGAYTDFRMLVEEIRSRVFQGSRTTDRP